MRAPSRVFWRRHIEVANQCVRGDRQEVSLAEFTQFQAKTRGTAHFVIARDPGCAAGPLRIPTTSPMPVDGGWKT